MPNEPDTVSEILLRSIVTILLPAVESETWLPRLKASKTFVKWVPGLNPANLLLKSPRKPLFEAVRWWWVPLRVRPKAVPAPQLDKVWRTLVIDILNAMPTLFPKLRFKPTLPLWYRPRAQLNYIPLFVIELTQPQHRLALFRVHLPVPPLQRVAIKSNERQKKYIKSSVFVNISINFPPRTLQPNEPAPPHTNHPPLTRQSNTSYSKKVYRKSAPP